MQEKKRKSDLSDITVLGWIVCIIVFFVGLCVVYFPISTLEKTPQVYEAKGVNGYVALEDTDNTESTTELFTLKGVWEFYPDRLYTFDDFTGGQIDDPQLVTFPHFRNTETDKSVGSVGYATYRMRVRVPPSFSGIGIYSRFQYSAYDIYLNDEWICGAGVVDEDFSKHQVSYVPANGYTSVAVGAKGRTFSVIIHVQNNVSDKFGLTHAIYFGSSESVKTLRTFLLTINGLISGGLFVLFICLLLIYLSGRERTEYRDYTVVSIVGLFLSLTAGGESLMYLSGMDSVLLARLEYCAFITGAFFANFSVFKSIIKSKLIYLIIYIYIALATSFFLWAPLMIATSLRIPIIAVSILFFVFPLLNSLINSIKKHNFASITSFLSYVVVFIGIVAFINENKPWDSVDIFSICILLHCVLHLFIFLYRYRKTESTLKDMTETLEERIAERTEELKVMKDKAEAATIAKSNFLATMSHEIRTPMNAIIGISDLIRTDNLDETQMNYMQNIKKSSKALLHIINDILDISKIEAGKFEIIPVHYNLLALYDNICSMCQFSADAKDLQFRKYFAPDVPHTVFGDEIRVRQVVINIINNAVKYTKAGYVCFSVEKTERDGVPYLTFTVEDTGIGIKEEDFEKLFRSFEQLDSRSNRKIVGTGLGLSISKHLVDLMHGNINFKSEYGKGSVFTVNLPLVEGDSSKVSIQETYISVQAVDANVLVVDDNQINLTVASGFLAVHGIYPDTALSGEEAIEKIKNKAYDLVFMDHMMPEMDGIEATQIIRVMEDGRFANLPIVALTANAVSGIRNLFISSGMNDFLSKPIDEVHMNALLARWLPSEKVTYESSEEACENNNEIVAELSRVEGLDVVDGLSHVSNNIPAYLTVVKQYCNEMDKTAAAITETAQTEDWKNYTIQVHAMKGVFANLGMTEVSKWAGRLETAAKNGDYSLCNNESEAFCLKMRDIRDKFMSLHLMEQTKPGDKTDADMPLVIKLLEELQPACMTGDSVSADEIRSKFLKMSFDSSIENDMADICSLIETFDYELVAQRAQEVIQKINI